MLKLLLTLMGFHYLGDYVLQTDYIAKGKNTDDYLLFVHCVLYTLPFVFVFDEWYYLLIIFVTHIIVDKLKCKGRINIVIDQILHISILIVIFLSTLINL